MDSYTNIQIYNHIITYTFLLVDNTIRYTILLILEQAYINNDSKKKKPNKKEALQQTSNLEENSI